MPTPLILARSFKEAHAFAGTELGLRVGHYRVVNTAGTLKAVRGVDLHLVPGWDRNPGHFAMKTALRYAKGLNIIDHAQVQAPAPVDPRGDLTERQLAVAYRYNALLDLSDEPSHEEAEAAVPEAVAQVTQDDEPVSNTLETEKPKKRRRSRCADCGNLHFKDEPCPEGE